MQESDCSSLPKSETDRKRVAEVYSSLGNTIRQATIAGLVDGKTIADLSRELNMTRSGLHNHFNKLLDSELTYRPSESGEPYALTPLGWKYVERGQISVEDITNTYEIIDQYEERIENRIEEIENCLNEIDENLDSVAGEAIDDKFVHTWKWEKGWEDVKNALDLNETPYEPEEPESLRDIY